MSDNEKRSIPRFISTKAAGSRRSYRVRQASPRRQKIWTPKAGLGIVHGTFREVPPALVKLRESDLYMKWIPQCICRVRLDREIEKQIQKQGLQDDDLIDTWTAFYEEVAYAGAFPYEDGLGADDV
mmetsp:Transcript_9728/g.14067  ORF Transcript_9728/g.14067 Transcript_9728/m.14067 type:complete len:126 (+) Transcript_9728:443-820(+)|eukprot:CAMPEP_0172436966 /NCGR_PEP_ID=MMETSP1064-20121228/72001_1 /TAXON_ID=202472 /ORGANISM="Aulacoseira subarctica , Strain CCAP 1002/5" /LENGTH=125 /DNA_ID=CAMNT_0013185397 /DNA_START=1108 /DNA_END=1485 /DNA_ORIENTATION=-